LNLEERNIKRKSFKEKEGRCRIVEYNLSGRVCHSKTARVRGNHRHESSICQFLTIRKNLQKGKEEEEEEEKTCYFAMCFSLGLFTYHDHFSVNLRTSANDDRSSLFDGDVYFVTQSDISVDEKCSVSNVDIYWSSDVHTLKERDLLEAKIRRIAT
jgi:hypothetical protein